MEVTQATLSALRRELHRYPELALEEHHTAQVIERELDKAGVPHRRIGATGVLATLTGGKGPGPIVALRADIDALPMQERHETDYCSQIDGKMHACGHDAHTAMLLGAAYVLNEMRDQFSGKVKLLFQPSEENAADSGAKKMIADGCLEDPHVDAVFGQHVWPNYDTGYVAVRNGAMMASSDRFFITVHGKNSHGSAPENGIDAIMIASYVVAALQSIVSRNVGPLDSAVVTIGKMNGGSRYNVIADEVVMEGTCRNLNPAVRNTMPQRIENIVKGVVEGMGGTYDFNYMMCYSPTVNDPKQFELVRDVIRDVVGPDHLVIPEHSALGGEDFSFYCEKVPSCFFWLGCHDPAKPRYPIHHGSFYPEWEALPIGMEVLVTSALKYLGNA